MSSVAMITESKSLARRQRSQTRRSNGLPAMRCNGLPRKRVEAQRAGMIPTALLIAYAGDPVCGGGQIARYELSCALIRGLAVPVVDQDCFHTRLPATLNIAVFVTNKKRPSQIQVVI